MTSLWHLSFKKFVAEVSVLKGAHEMFFPLQLKETSSSFLFTDQSIVIF